MPVHLEEHEMMTLQRPRPGDGSNVWALIRDAGGLDVNSAYCYMLLCDHFRDTCVIARRGEATVGFVSAYEKPLAGSVDGNADDARADESAQTLFVWQIAVHADERGKGLGSRLLHALVERRNAHCAGAWFLETTISPSNRASKALFEKLAREFAVACSQLSGYGSDSFPEGSGHEEEILFRLGPFTHKQ